MFCIFNYLPESPRFLLQINEKEKALEILEAMYVINTGNPKEVNPTLFALDWKHKNIRDFLLDVSGERNPTWADRKKFRECKRIFQYNEIGVVANETDFCATILGQNGENVIYDFRAVCHWPRHFYVVCVYFELPQPIELNLYASSQFTYFHRIPDFLVQLQNNIGSSKTMCEIVSQRVASNEYVQFQAFFWKIFRFSSENIHFFVPQVQQRQ